MSSTEPIRVVRTEQDVKAPTSEGTVYVCEDGSPWRNASGQDRTGATYGHCRGGYIQPLAHEQAQSEEKEKE